MSQTSIDPYRSRALAIVDQIRHRCGRCPWEMKYGQGCFVPGGAAAPYSGGGSVLILAVVVGLAAPGSGRHDFSMLKVNPEPTTPNQR